MSCCRCVHCSARSSSRLRLQPCLRTCSGSWSRHSWCPSINKLQLCSQSGPGFRAVRASLCTTRSHVYHAEAEAQELSAIDEKVHSLHSCLVNAVPASTLLHHRVERNVSKTEPFGSESHHREKYAGPMHRSAFCRALSFLALAVVTNIDLPFAESAFVGVGQVGCSTVLHLAVKLQSIDVEPTTGDVFASGRMDASVRT